MLPGDGHLRRRQEGEQQDHGERDRHQRPSLYRPPPAALAADVCDRLDTGFLELLGRVDPALFVRAQTGVRRYPDAGRERAPAQIRGDEHELTAVGEVAQRLEEQRIRQHRRSLGRDDHELTIRRRLRGPRRRLEQTVVGAEIDRRAHQAALAAATATRSAISSAKSASRFRSCV